MNHRHSAVCSSFRRPAAATARAIAVACVFVAMILRGAAPAAAQARTATIVVPTPQPQRFHLALDEMWFEVADTSAPWRGRLAADGLTLRGLSGRTLAAAIAGALSPADLVEHGRRFQLATPGVEEFFLVLYEPTGPQDAAHRALLTSEVAVVLDDGIAPADVFDGARPVRSVPGVARGYVVRADDPLAAVRLAGDLAGRRGVSAAYPLLRRTEFPR